MFVLIKPGLIKRTLEKDQMMVPKGLNAKEIIQKEEIINARQADHRVGILLHHHEGVIVLIVLNAKEIIQKEELLNARQADHRAEILLQHREVVIALIDSSVMEINQKEEILSAHLTSQQVASICDGKTIVLIA